MLGFLIDAALAVGLAGCIKHIRDLRAILDRRGSLDS